MMFIFENMGMIISTAIIADGKPHIAQLYSELWNMGAAKTVLVYLKI